MLKGLSLKTKMILTVSGTLMLMLGIFALLAFPFFEDHFKDSIRSHQQALVDAVAQEIDTKFNTAQDFLSSLATNASPDDFREPRRAQRFLEQHSDNLQLFDNGILVYAPDGTMIAFNPFDATLVGQSFADREYHRVTSETLKPFISPPFSSRQEHGRTVIMLTQPVLDHFGDLVAILAGSIFLDNPHALGNLLDIRIGHHGRLYLYTAQGEPVLHPDEDSPHPGEMHTGPADAHLKEEQLLLHGVDDESFLYAKRHLTKVDWVLGAIFPIEEALAPYRQGKHLFQGGILLAGAGCLIILWFLMQPLTRPVTRLTDYVEALAEDATTSFPQELNRRDEIGILARSFSTLVSDLVLKEGRLQDQLSFLQNLIDTIPNPIFYKDAKGRYIGGNTAWEEYLGKKLEDMVGKSVFDIAPRHLAEIYDKADRELMSTRGTQVYESSVLYADGTLRDVIFYKRVFLNADGTPGGMLGTIVDISQRKRAENDLKRSEALLSTVLQHAGNGILALDSERRVIYWNQRMADMFRLSAELLKARPQIDDLIRYACRSGIYPSDMEDELVARRISHLTNCRETQTLETPRVDGTVVEAYATPLPDGGHILVFYDITAHKQVEEKLQQALAEAEGSRDHISTIIRSIADGLIVTDPRNRVQIINHVAGDILNLSASESMHRSIVDLVYGSPLAKHFGKAITLKPGANLHSDVQIPDVDPLYPQTIQARSQVMKSTHGEKTGIITTLIDVTRERELDRMKNEFISTAAHELRTPLTSILGFTELLLNQSSFRAFSEEEKFDFLQEIYSKGEILEQIIDDLLDISRIEQGRMIVLERSPLDITDLLQKVMNDFKMRTTRHSLELNLGPLQPVAIFADRNKLIQVMENLLSNAIKYSPKGGTISISGVLEGDDYEISVRDEGIGMTADQLERIFEKFYRADQTDTSVGGLGLGMSIVKTIVETHGGTIRVESTRGEGTLVTLRIPARSEKIT